MNEASSKFLLNWINVNASREEEKVQNITDPGSKNLLLKILHLIDKETLKDLPGDSDEFHLEQVLSLIISYLKGNCYNKIGQDASLGFHRQDFYSVINEDYLRNRNELEIAKVITLLLCGATQCDNVAVFVDQISKMDVEDQFSFKFLIESVFTDMEQGFLTAESFATILSKQVNLSECQKLDLDSDHVPSPLTVQSPVEAFFTNSPLKSLVGSPQLHSKQNQLMLNKLQQKVTKLQASLDSQAHLQSDLEAEVTEKNKEIDARDTTIFKLRKEITKLLSSADELELMRHFKDEYEKANKENARLKQKVVELQTFKQQCGDLEQKVTNFIQEKEQFEKKREETDRLKATVDRYKNKIHHMEFTTGELEATLKRKEQMIATLQKDLEEAFSAASKSTEMRMERQRSKTLDDEELRESEDESPRRHTPLAAVNIDSRVIELEIEKNRLESRLSMAVNEEEYLALKETLEDTKKVQTSFKEEYVAARSRIQELEHQLAVEVQKSEQKDEQLKNIQEHCFQEVEELKSALSREHSLKAEIVEKLDIREKRLQETTIEIQALTSLKAGLEGSLQTSNARAHDNQLKYEKEITLMKNEVEELTKQRQRLEEELESRLQQIQTSEKERDQVREAYEKMLADLKSELDSKIVSMAQEKAAVASEFRSKTNQFEEEYEKMKEDFANKQKAMLEEAERNAAKIREACDAERVAWKKKFDQLSVEAMNTRSEMFENSKKHSEELIEVRKKALEEEERLDEEARKTREDNVHLENQLLKSRNIIAELELEVKGYETTKKELELERKKCFELKGKCESYVSRVEELEASVELLRKEAETEKERTRNELRQLEEARQTEVNGVQEVLESLKKDYSALEMKRQQEGEVLAKLEKDYSELEKKWKEEIEKIIGDEKKTKDELLVRVNELEVKYGEKVKQGEELELLLKETLQTKEDAVNEVKSSEAKWESKEKALLTKIEELKRASKGMKETEKAFAELKDHVRELQAEKDQLEQKVEEETLINRRLGTEVHSMEAQLAHADKQIRELRKTTAEFKSSTESPRRKTIGGERAEMYARQDFFDEDSSTDTDEGPPLKLTDFASSVKGSLKASTLPSNTFNQLNRSLDTLRSASSSSLRAGVQTRASRRQSAIYMRGNTPPEKRTTNSAAYFILGEELGPEMEDTEMEYDWDRLAELQRRNASCLPHLQTSYPVETQMNPDFSGQEDALKTGRMSLDASLTKGFQTRKRKSEESVSSLFKAKNSGRPNIAKSKSAPSITPAKQARSQRIATAMQSAIGSLRSRSNENLLNEATSDENSSRRESIAFKIEMSPPKKTKTSIARRRTIARSMASSCLIDEGTRRSLKKTKSQNLVTSTAKDRKPLRPRDLKKNAK